MPFFITGDIHHKMVQEFFHSAPSLDHETKLTTLFSLFPYAENMEHFICLIDIDKQYIISNKRIDQHDFSKINSDSANGFVTSLVESTIGVTETKWLTITEAIATDLGESLGSIVMSICLSPAKKRIHWNKDKNKIALQSSTRKTIELSLREFGVLRDMLKGATAAEISVKDEVSPKTIETYLMRIKSRFGFQKQRELMAYLIEEELAKEILRFKADSPIKILENLPD